MVSLQDLIKARVHFGHRTSRWCPKMAPYIWGEKNDIHLIDIAKTAVLLERAAKFLESVVADGKSVLWVGTKKAAQETVKNAAVAANSAYVTNRWIGGTLTNFSQVNKSVRKYLHYQDIIAKSEQFNYTKKELNKIQKNMAKLSANVGGIVNMQWPIGALVVVDIHKEHAALREALRSGIPVVALVDTNTDPSGIQYVIPGNDDAVSSIAFIVNYLQEATVEGLKKAKERVQKEAENVEAKKEKQDSEDSAKKNGKAEPKVAKKKVETKPKSAAEGEAASKETEEPAVSQ